MHNCATTNPPSLLCWWGNIPEACRQISCFSWEMRWPNTSCPEDPLQILPWAQQTFFIRCEQPFLRQVTVPNISRKCCWLPELTECESALPCLIGSNHPLPFVVFLSLGKPWQQQGSAEHSDFSLGTVALACYLRLEMWFGKASTIPPIWKKKQ